MSKVIFLVAVIATLAIGILADADGDADAGAPLFPDFPAFPEIPPIPPMPKLDDIKDMEPLGPNSHVEGTSVSRHSSSETVNGVPVEKSDKERVVTNRDGKVTDNTYGN